MGGGLRHAPRVAGRAHAAPFAGEGDQEVVPALVAMGAGEAVSENAAVEIAAKGLLNMGGGGDSSPCPVESVSQVSKCVCTVRYQSVFSGRRR